MQQLQSDGSYNELYPKTDAWTKDETLSAQVASVLGLRDDYKPDDAFLGLYFGAGVYRYRVRVVLEDGTPASGCVISGIDQIQGLSLTTDEQGYVLGKSVNQSVTIKCVSGYIDQAPPSDTKVTSTGTLTDVILTLTKNSDLITQTTSVTKKISHLAKTMDVTVVRGGGGGRVSNAPHYDNGYGGGGGGGGNIETVLNLALDSFVNVDLKFNVGAGGSPNTSKTSKFTGGTTQISHGDINIISVTGGESRGYGDTPSSGSVVKRGNSINGGVGGDGCVNDSVLPTNGKNATSFIFNDASLGLARGGGGGGGWNQTTTLDPNGGSPYGGTGTSHSVPAENGRRYGGGGGGGGWWSTAAGSGHSGVMYLRFHF